MNFIQFFTIFFFFCFRFLVSGVLLNLVLFIQEYSKKKRRRKQKTHIYILKAFRDFDGLMDLHNKCTFSSG